MLTEARNPRSQHIDQSSTLDILKIINDEDASIAGAVREALPMIAQAVDIITERLRDGGRLFYIGAGTSGRLGILDAAECVPTFSTPPTLVQGIIAGGITALTDAVEGAEDNHEAGKADLLARGLTNQDVVVGLAASGQTPYVIGALEAANNIGAVTIALTCNTPAPMLDIAQIGITALVGPEVITGSTRMKSGTAQKLILNMISTTTMIKLGKVYGNLMVDVKPTNQKLIDRACRIICEITGVSYQEAEHLLAASGQQVKTAIVMALLGISAEDAHAQLETHHGILANIIKTR